MYCICDVCVACVSITAGAALIVNVCCNHNKKKVKSRKEKPKRQRETRSD